MDDDGKVSIVDRSKDVIITGGETVPSVEIEAVYMEHPHIAECAAVGIEDEKWGEAILLVAAKSNPSVNDADLAADLYAYGRQNLAGIQGAENDRVSRCSAAQSFRQDIETRSSLPGSSGVFSSAAPACGRA